MKKISELINGLKQYNCKADCQDIVISQISTDSRLVKPGDLFVCLIGENFDGHKFAHNAVEAGAVALLVQKALPIDVVQVVVPDTLVALSHIAAAFYDYPSRQIKVLGITGTNGKTTTTYMVKHILEARGEKVGVIGTLAVYDGQSTIPAKLTTPLSLEMQKYLRKMVDNGCTFAVMEVSSHALVLHRVLDVEFYGAGFTNLTQDHLNFHGSFEAYLEAKSVLFTKQLSFAIINRDDAAGLKIAQKCHAPVLFYSCSDRNPEYLFSSEVKRVATSTMLTVNYKKLSISTQIAVIGDFNISNALLAMGIVMNCGFSLSQIVHDLKTFPGVPGRFELISHQRDFLVVVDFAHTPDALQNVLQTAVAFKQKRLIVVFGCGGDRDRSKRPKMGRVAGNLADYVIITSDNPRSEEPADIALDIEKGLMKVTAHYEVIIDRAQAIRRAITMAQDGDVVLIAGRGHEPYQKIKNRVIPFDDRKVATSVLEEVQKSGQMDS